MRLGDDGSADKEDKIFNDLILENESLGKAREDILKQLQSIPREYRIKRFKSITEKLLNCGLIRAICKTKEDMEKFINLRYTAVQTVQDITDIVKTIEAITKANSQVVAPETVNNAFDELKKNNEENNDEDTGSGQVKTLSQKEGRLCPDNINGKQINFFYLGDLMDVILDDLFISSGGSTKTNDFRSKSTRILLGSITYYDFGSLNSSGLIYRNKGVLNEEGEKIRTYRGKKEVANIADIPISLEEFVAWFVNNYADRENISFLEFAKALVNDFIVVAFSRRSFKFCSISTSPS